MNIPLLDLTKDEAKWTAMGVTAGGMAVMLFEAARSALMAGEYVPGAIMALAAVLCAALAYWTTIPDEAPASPAEPVTGMEPPIMPAPPAQDEQ